MSSAERATLEEIARAHGGDHLAVWTFGHAVHAWLARSSRPGQPLAVRGPFSLRLRAPGSERRPDALATLRQWFEGSALQPDFAALEAQVAAPQISVRAWFEAFGLAGAREVEPPDTAALWEDFGAVANAILAGGAADRKAVKRVNEALGPAGEEDRLPAKGGKPGKGVTARVVADAAFALAEAVGRPGAGTAERRQQDAELYWDITDGPAVRRLTVGGDKKGTGDAAALARLLAHYPRGRLRDPVFLALAALECEAANGHAFVEPLKKLAELASRAGVVAVVVPVTFRSALRQAFGIEAQAEAPEDMPPGPWAGEAFLQAPGLPKVDLVGALRGWLGKQGVDGLLALLGADGAAAVEVWKQGVAGASPADLGLAAPDRAALGEAATALDARAVFPALGVGDLLAPGLFTAGSYHGLSRLGGTDHRAVKRRFAEKALESLPAAQPITEWGELKAVFGPRLTYRGELPEMEGGLVSLRLVVPGADPAFLRDLRNDLQGERMTARYGEVWTARGEVRAYMCSDYDTALLAAVLADLPAGTRLALAVGPKGVRHFALRQRGEAGPDTLLRC